MNARQSKRSASVPRSKKQKQKRKQRQQSGPEQHLKQLEKQHTKLAALLHVADQQDQKIREAAIAAHDQINEQIKQIAPQLRAQGARPDPELSKRYGELLKKRKQLHGVIVGARDRHWDRGHPSPI
jgi:hypothetical protein